MANLLELTQQGDAGTITDESKLSSIELMNPQQLYELWEKQNWISAQIDFTQDKEDWAALPEEDKRHMAWNLSSFFVGEERVTTQFSGLVCAYESQSEEAFLTTQQVDEARHAQHFNRFYEQVVRYDGTFDERLQQARQDLNEPFKVLFDEHLRRRRPGAARQPGRHRGQGRLRDALPHDHRRDARPDRARTSSPPTSRTAASCPGFLEGFRLISQDEHRHVAYGTWFLREKCKDPALKKRCHDKLAEMLPVAAGVFVPPGLQLGDDYEIFGFSSDEVNQFAFTALSRRLKVIGIGLPAAPAEAAA